MVFSSLAFLFGFLPLFLAAYWLTPGLRAKNLLLTVASYLFYAWWRPDFVVLMFVSTLVDWHCSLRMAGRPLDDRPGRRRWLLVSLVTNLGLLAWFKYANFAVDTLGALGVGPSDWEDVVLPVGISFYTFQSLSYTVDVYRGHVKPVRSVLDLACYVAMFPQLVAGPIVRYRDIAEQILARVTSVRFFAGGVALFAIGLVKKVLVADHCALVAGPIFAASEPGFLDAWLGVGAYSLQIYFDFSGYSDMAIGLGLLLGFRLPINFDSPFQSASITEFWQRWHISLSTWLRDYLYVPLGGNRRGPARTYFNLLATMLLGGLWHGAAWTFVIWGGYHGAFLVLERWIGKRAAWSALPRPLQVAATFAVFTGSMAPFAAPDVGTTVDLWSAMLGFAGWGELPTVAARPVHAWLGLTVGALLAFFAKNSAHHVRRFSPWTLALFAALFVVAIGQLAARSHTPFLYFRF